MSNLDPDRKKELRYIKKQKKIQARRESKGKYYFIPGTQIKLWVKNGENPEEKIREYKNKLIQYKK